jgi:hypothetical protein
MPPQLTIGNNMRDQTAALKYLAEKQFDRIEREHRRDLILAALLAPVMVTVMALFFLYV